MEPKVTLRGRPHQAAHLTTGQSLSQGPQRRLQVLRAVPRDLFTPHACKASNQPWKFWHFEISMPTRIPCNLQRLGAGGILARCRLQNQHRLQCGLTNSPTARAPPRGFRCACFRCDGLGHAQSEATICLSLRRSQRLWCPSGYMPRMSFLDAHAHAAPSSCCIIERSG